MRVSIVLDTPSLDAMASAIVTPSLVINGGIFIVLTITLLPLGPIVVLTVSLINFTLSSK